MLFDTYIKQIKISKHIKQLIRFVFKTRLLALDIQKIISSLYDSVQIHLSYFKKFKLSPEATFGHNIFVFLSASYIIDFSQKMIYFRILGCTLTICIAILRTDTFFIYNLCNTASSQQYKYILQCSTKYIYQKCLY